jgi:hypothetical protein
LDACARASLFALVRGEKNPQVQGVFRASALDKDSPEHL